MHVSEELLAELQMKATAGGKSIDEVAEEALRIGLWAQQDVRDLDELITWGDRHSGLDAELERLESAKWHPSSLGVENVLALFADDFVTVEYGADLHGGVERKFNAKIAMASPEGAQFFQFLDQIGFELSDWHLLHINAVGVVISYRVVAPSLAWKACGTSVWAKRGDKWQTVFYQASNAK